MILVRRRKFEVGYFFNRPSIAHTSVRKLDSQSSTKVHEPGFLWSRLLSSSYECWKEIGRNNLHRSGTWEPNISSTVQHEFTILVGDQYDSLRKINLKPKVW